MNGKSRVVKASFSSSNLTKYSGLNTVAPLSQKQIEQKIKYYQQKLDEITTIEKVG